MYGSPNILYKTAYRIVGSDNAAGHPEGTACYRFVGHDYGCAREDTEHFRRDFVSMTLNLDGSGPFFTAPADGLEVINE